MSPLPLAWQPHLGHEIALEYFRDLEAFLAAERSQHIVFPPHEQVFAAFEHTPFEGVRAVILGQDPYHGEGQAHGLAFSVSVGVKPPPSLVNIFKELQADLGVPIPDNGCLIPWAKQGVLLLNTVLTVRAGEANSHKKKGWEQFTNAVIRRLNERTEPMAFVLWGAPAQRKAALLDASRHAVVQAVHPSPLSAHRGFFGSRPFSQVNEALRAWGLSEINWRIPNLDE